MSDELPSGWAWSTLGAVARWGSGGTPKKSVDKYYGGEIPWAVIGDLNDALVYDCVGSITPLGLAESSCKLVKPGTLLVAMYGSIGKLGVAAREMATNQAIAHAVPLIDRDYLFYFLLSERRSLNNAGKGATQQNISQTVLKAWHVPVPPLAEQERIVAAIEEHLSRLDAAEASVRSAERRLDLFRRAAVRELFDEPEWEWTTLGQIAEVKGGVTKDSKRQNDPEFTEVPYLRVANVQRGFLDLQSVATIRVSPKKADQLALVPGDILFNEGGDRDKLGRGWVWEGQIDGCIHQNHVFRARLHDDDFDPRFVSTHGNTWGQQWFEQHGKQTTNLASLNLTTLKAFPVPAPRRLDQEALMAKLDGLLQSERRLSGEVGAAASRAKALRRSILSAAVSGQLAPHDPDDEPASVLLERIAAERPTKASRKKKS